MQRYPSHRVIAVVVAHDGARWLPQTLTAIAQQTRAPDLVLAVDASSDDASGALLREALGEDAVHTVTATTGFGAGVTAALAKVPAATEGDQLTWYWLLHDDSAPDSDCLEELLAEAERSTSATVLGPKIRDWNDSHRLLEVGVSVTTGGTRLTSLEHDEQDQGQHDGVRDVFAVNTAGMLVRARTWDNLTGLNPYFPFVGDDVDFGWRAQLAGDRILIVTRAVLRHVNAASHGKRPTDSHTLRTGTMRKLKRQRAHQLLLTHAAWWMLPVRWLTMFLSTLLRTLAFLVGKDLRAARDEVGAFVGVHRELGGLAASRRLANSSRRLSRRSVRHLQVSRWEQLQSGIESLGGILSPPTLAEDADAGTRAESEMDPDADLWSQSNQPAWWRRHLTRGWFPITLLLVILGLLGMRSLFGPGQLLGGALLPAPDGAGDLWARYLAPWHDVMLGSDIPASPYLAILALLAFPLLGNAELLVTILIFGAIPLAGLSAHLALGRLVRSRLLRAWMSVAYALLPPVTVGIAGGRLGVIVAAIVLPWFIRVLARQLGLDQRPAHWQGALGAGILLAIMVAFVPMVWVLLGAVLVVAALAFALRRHFAVAGRALITLILPLPLLFPWSWWLLQHPGQFWYEVGAVPTGVDAAAPAQIWQVLLLQPGGPGSTGFLNTWAQWAGAGLVLAGVVALFRRERSLQVSMAWFIGLVGLAGAIVQVAVSPTPLSGSEPAPSWPGFALLLFGGALIVAVGLAAAEARAGIQRSVFGLAQLLSGIALIAAVAMPILLGAHLVTTGMTGPLHRSESPIIPAFVAADMAGEQAPRALLLQRERHGSITYVVLGTHRPMIGDADVAPPVTQTPDLTDTVQNLVTGESINAVKPLRDYAIKYVIVAESLDTRQKSQERLYNHLNGNPGLTRLSSSDVGALWRVDDAWARANLVTLAEVEEQVRVTSADEVLPVTREKYSQQVAASGLSTEATQAVLYAVAAMPGWQLHADGVEVELTAIETETEEGMTAGAGMLAPTRVPVGTAEVTIDFASDRGTQLGWQLAALIVVVVLLLPSRKRGGEQ